MLERGTPELRRHSAWILVPQAAAAGEPARARDVLNPLVHSVAGAAAQARGLGADQEELLAAVDHFEQSPRRPALTSALEDAGAMAARNGERAQAIALLGRALTLSAEMGAVWDTTRIRRRLRHLGVRRRLTRIERPSSGWGALTVSELAVGRAITGPGVWCRLLDRRESRRERERRSRGGG